MRRLGFRPAHLRPLKGGRGVKPRGRRASVAPWRVRLPRDRDMRRTTIFTVERAEYIAWGGRERPRRIGLERCCIARRSRMDGGGSKDGSSRPSTTAQRCPRLIVPRREHSAMQAAHVWSPRNSCQPKGPSQCQRKEVAGPTHVGALPKWYPTKAGWLDGIRLRADHLSPC
jgi:hypothetical protein